MEIKSKNYVNWIEIQVKDHEEKQYGKYDGDIKYYVINQIVFRC